MKKIFTFFALLLSMTMFAQTTETTEVSETNKASMYVSVGLSMSNLKAYTVENAEMSEHITSFKDGSYASVEVGVTKGNISFGAVLGRGHLDFSANDDISNYFYEGKVALSQPIGNAEIYGLFGVGNYFGKEALFIEYGAGVSYNLTNNMAMFVQASNWDGVWYMTPGLTYNF